mgnify:CR=1 FL=1
MMAFIVGVLVGVVITVIAVLTVPDAWLDMR